MLAAAVSDPGAAEPVELDAFSSAEVRFCSASTRLATLLVAVPVVEAALDDWSCSAVRKFSASCENWPDGGDPDGEGQAAPAAPWGPPEP